MTGGDRETSTQIWGLEIYRAGFSQFDLGRSSALSVLLFAGMLCCSSSRVQPRNVEARKGSL